MEHHGFKFINSESTTRELATLLYTTPSLLLQHPTASVATVPCPGLPGPAPSQAPQSTHREDGGEERGHADRDERPDEEKGSAGVGDPAAVHHTLPHHVEDGDAQRKERSEEHDDVSRSPLGEHQCSVQPDDTDGHSSEVYGRSRQPPADDVVRQVKRHEEDREQRRDG